LESGGQNSTHALQISARAGLIGGQFAGELPAGRVVGEVIDGTGEVQLVGSHTSG